MIIWSGLGWLVAVIAFGCLVLTEYVVEDLVGDEAYYQAHGWPKLAGLGLAALILFAVWVWRRRQIGRVMIDAETGEEVVFVPADALFFIPLRFWPVVCVGLGIVFLFVEGP